MDDADRLPCADIACARDGHKRCRDAGVERGAERLADALRETGVTSAEWAQTLQRCREEDE